MVRVCEYTKSGARVRGTLSSAVSKGFIGRCGKLGCVVVRYRHAQVHRRARARGHGRGRPKSYRYYLSMGCKAKRSKVAKCYMCMNATKWLLNGIV